MAFPNRHRTSSLVHCNDAEDKLRRSAKRGVDQDFIESASRIAVSDLPEVLNKRYSVGNDQEATILIEATLNGNTTIIKYMLSKYSIDLNAEGKVKQFGSLQHGATALWCAAGSGYFEIVKVLVEKGANVDCFTTTKSTPLRAACYIGHTNIVKYLIEHGANVNLTNIFNSTCLMIAAYKGHTDIVICLLKNGADVNKQTNCGATAMHFAAQANNLQIVRILVTFKAQQLKNNQSLTPVLIAADRTHHKLVNYLLNSLNLTREEKIEAKELLGASFLNDKDTYDKELGFSILKSAMELRYKDHPVLYKKPFKIIEAYDNRVECQTIEELVNIKNNIEALHYESLIIRERILGDTNLDLLPSIIYRGAVYADMHNFTPCLKLWNHAMKITQKNKRSVLRDLLRFTQVFCQMIKANILIKLTDLKNVLDVAVDELKINKGKLSSDNIDEQKGIEAEYNANILSTLGLIIITSIVLEQDGNSEDPLVGDVMKTIVEINKLKLRTKEDQTLLHLCLNYDTNVDNVFTTGICCFPNYLSMKLLIYCGADVDAFDNNQNTPLHYIGKFIIDFPHIPHESDDLDTKKMVLELLNAGAHTDYVNKNGECPHTGYLTTLLNLTNKIPRTLKCLSARVLKYKCPKEYYEVQLPKILIEFTNLH